MTDWQRYPWTMIVFVLASVIGGIWWGGGLTQRVQAAEDKTSDIIVKLDRIEDKLDRLIERFLP